MIPNQTLTPYPEFGDSSTKVKPDDPKYSAGFIPTDVLPAEWLNWFLNRASTGVTELGAGVASMEEEINNVLSAGGETPDVDTPNQLITAINAIITAVRTVEQQLPPIGVPTLWFSSKPDWALDFGNGAATQYLWANYPKLNNTKFKDILSTLSTGGWMTAYDATGFYVPDLRGIVPIGYSTNDIRTSETTAGGNIGQYLESQNKYHRHIFSGVEIKGQIINLAYTTWDTLFTGAFTATKGAMDRGVGSGSNFGGVYGNFKATPSGTISYEGVSGQTSKPATIGCMWIVRYE